MNKLFTSVICVFLLLMQLTINGQSWQWTKRIGTQYVNDSYTDGYGNTFLTGGLNGARIVGTNTLTGTHGNVYVSKLDSNGTILWAVEPGNTTNVIDGIAITGDPQSGGCYLLGATNGTATASVGSFTFAGSNGYCYFLSKLDGNGNVVWATRIGNAYNPGIDVLRGDIKCDASGNVYITGSFTGTVTIGAQILVPTISGNIDMFIAKFDANGNGIWAKKAGSNESTLGTSLALDQNSNCYVTGYYSSTNPNTTYFGNLSFSSPGSSGGIYLAKYDALGTEQFAVNGKGGNPRSITVDNSGNAYITGIFTGTLNVQGYVVTSYTNASFTSNDPFAAKFSPTGQVVYVRHGGSGQGGNTGSVNELGAAIVVLPNHEAIATGDFYTTGVFGSLSVVSNTAGLSPNAFIVKYNSGGTENMLIKNGSSTSSTRAMGLGLDADHNIYVAGTHVGTGNFGSQSVTYNEVDSCVYLTRIKNVSSVTDVVAYVNQIAGNNPMCSGSLATFSASVINGGSNPSYQWYVNGTPVGANTPTYSTTSLINNNSVYCVATSDMSGATNNPAVSEAIIVNVNNMPVSVASTTVCFGGTVSLVPSVQYSPASYLWSNGATTSSISVSPTLTSVYTVSLTYPGGCIKTTSSTVTVNPIGTLTISAPSGTRCPKTAITLNGSGAASTYTWVNGPTGTTYNTVTPTVTTTYTLNGSNSNGCLYTGTKTIDIYTFTPIVAIASSSIICRGQFVTLSVSGAVSYTYSGYPTPGTITINPTSTSIYTATTRDANSCLITNTISVGVDNSALFFTSPSTSTICAGNNVGISVSNPTNTYVWQPGSLTGTMVTVAPMANTVYSVVGTSGACSYSASSSIYTKPSVSLSVSSSGTLTCVSQPTLYASASPSVTYAWYYKNGANMYSAGSTTTSVVAWLNFPYYCIVTYTPNSCVTTASISFPVDNANPPLTYTTPVSICKGSTAQVLVGGAATYNFNYTGVTTNTVFVASPTVTTTYSLVGVGNNGCSKVLYPQIVVNPNPTITVTYPTSICVGSSANIIASGANAYSWSTGANTSSINVIASINEIFSVTGTDINNCSTTQTISIIVDNGCSDVWPGDANSDGTANNLDVLELGLHYTQTGTPRATIDNSWQSFHADNWTGTISNGKNVNHSDCNGDGTINDADTLAIYNNYGLTHAFKQNNINVTNPQLSIVPNENMLLMGYWGSADIFLGDASNPISNMNGLAFTVDFDNTLIEQDSIYLEYTNSFMDASNQNLKFRKLDFTSSKLFTATTHTNNMNVSGNGKIGTLHYKIKYPLSQTYTLQVGLSQANQSDNSGVISPLTTGTGTVEVVNGVTGIQNLSVENLISIFPNPAANELTVRGNSDIEKIEITNLTGQMILTEQVNSRNHKMNLENVANGVYFVKVYNTSKQISVRKLVVNK